MRKIPLFFCLDGTCGGVKSALKVKVSQEKSAGILRKFRQIFLADRVGSRAEEGIFGMIGQKICAFRGKTVDFCANLC